MEKDRKSTRLNSSHTVIYTLSLHDALPIFVPFAILIICSKRIRCASGLFHPTPLAPVPKVLDGKRSEEHTSELQSHSDLHSFPTRRSSDLCPICYFNNLFETYPLCLGAFPSNTFSSCAKGVGWK